MSQLFRTLVSTILISLAMHVCGRSISVINGVINCGGIECPSESVGCTITEKTAENITLYKYSRTCYDANGNVTLHKEEDLPNPNPGISIDTFSRVGGEPTEEEKREAEYWRNWGEEQTKLWRDWGKRQEKYWENWRIAQQRDLDILSANLASNLRNIFTRNFPFY